MHTTLWFPLQKIKKKNITQLSSPQSPYTQKYKNTFNPTPSEAVKGQHYK